MTISVLALVVLTGCSASTQPPRVARLSDGAAPAPSATAQDAEAALLSFVECLRSKGLDVPDPTVDAKGKLVDGPGGTPAVRVVDDQNERVVPVATGIVADGWVEITSGLNGGELVRLPG